VGRSIKVLKLQRLCVDCRTTQAKTNVYYFNTVNALTSANRLYGLRPLGLFLRVNPFGSLWSPCPHKCSNVRFVDVKTKNICPDTRQHFSGFAASHQRIRPLKVHCLSDEESLLEDSSLEYAPLEEDSSLEYEPLEDSTPSGARLEKIISFIRGPRSNSLIKESELRLIYSKLTVQLDVLGACSFNQQPPSNVFASF